MESFFRKTNKYSASVVDRGRERARKRCPYIVGRSPRNVTPPWANLLCKLEDVFLLPGENTGERSRQKNPFPPPGQNVCLVKNNYVITNETPLCLLRRRRVPRDRRKKWPGHKACRTLIRVFLREQPKFRCKTAWPGNTEKKPRQAEASRRRRAKSNDRCRRSSESRGNRCWDSRRARENRTAPA